MIIQNRFSITVSATAALLATIWLAPVSVQAADDEDKSDNDKTLYFLGMSIGSNLEMLDLSEAEAEALVEGLKDTLAGEAEALDPGVYGEKVNQFTNERMQAAQVREQSASAGYLTEMAAEEGAITTESGLVYRELVAGDGVQPSAASSVRAHYTGTLRNGEVFDSSRERGQPLTISLNQVIPCWTEAIALMQEGGRSKITCPASIAYGERGSGSIPPGAVISFDVELIEVVK
jgi:FKBP-type peptidyl-prolyl cis-trans isomerase FkpA